MWSQSTNATLRTVHLIFDLPTSSAEHFLGQTERLSERHFSQCIPRARLVHIVLWVLCQKWFDQQCCRLSAAQFLEWRSGSLHLAPRFWNLISGRRVKGWRPWPDPAENGACVKRFTPWAGEEGFRSSVEGGETPLARQTLSTSSLDHP